MKRLVCLLRLSLLAAALIVPGWAGLVGQSVTGVINFGGGSTNYFDPVNGFVPAGYLNTAGATVVITLADVEYGFQDGANRDAADFTATQLIIADLVFSGASNWSMQFTSSTPGLFTSINQAVSTFVPGLTYSLTGDTITIEWAGTAAPADFSAAFDIGSGGQAPEPATFGLLGSALVALAVFRRRARR